METTERYHEWLEGVKTRLADKKTKKKQVDIAREVGVTPVHLNAVLRGRRRAGNALQDAVSRALGLSHRDVRNVGREALGLPPIVEARQCLHLRYSGTADEGSGAPAEPAGEAPTGKQRSHLTEEVIRDALENAYEQAGRQNALAARRAAMEPSPFDAAMQSWFTAVKQWCRAEYGDDDAAAQAFIQDFGDKFSEYRAWLARRQVIKNPEERGVEPGPAPINAVNV